MTVGISPGIGGTSFHFYMMPKSAQWGFELITVVITSSRAFFKMLQTIWAVVLE